MAVYESTPGNQRVERTIRFKTFTGFDIQAATFIPAKELLTHTPQGSGFECSDHLLGTISVAFLRANRVCKLSLAGSEAVIIWQI